MSSKVKVAVRVRPFNRREIELGAKIVVDMIEEQTILLSLRGDKKQNKIFTFDHSFWSIDENNKKFAGQEKVYGCLGKDLLQNAFEGYNACIFAYGQTGSGKTYTMMGATGQKGLIPRLCDELFDRINKNDDQNVTYRVEVSYIEIYNEKVRDLLCPRGGLASLRVREHKVLGPYVEGLTKLVVSSFADIEALIIEGNKSRTVAATNMNAESSRSHAVFNIVLARSEYDNATETVGEKVSKVSLVDLAGSERVSKTGAEGDRLKEGSNINRSLTTLGQVISSLADQSAGKQKKGTFVPYRDSVLTWLLKDNLGGNSRTVMVATVSPSSDNHEETLSTLRYADRAKRIVNHAVINEDPNARIIRELREEVEMLKALLKEKIAEKPTGTKETVEIQEMLSENEKLMKECTMSWEQKEKQTEQIMHERHKALEEMGISVQSSGIAVEKGKFYLVNLNADPAMNELLVYYLKDHTLVGKPEAPHTPGIQLSGLGILPEHARLDIEDNEVFVTPFPHANTCVNGKVVQEKTLLRHGDRILWGNNHFFRINCPRPPGSENQPDLNQPEQPSDFQFAYNEIMMNELQAGPLHDAMNTLEEQYKADKEGALEKQRQMYEEKIEELRNQMSPMSKSPYNMERTSSLSSFSSGYGSRMSCLDDSFGRELPYQAVQKPLVLKEEVVKANALVREANQFSEEMGKDTEFAVTLQIPTSSLSYGRPRSGFSSEVAIVVKHNSKGTQIWSLEKLSNKMFDMRDLYQQCVEENVPFREKDPDSDLFFEVECHTLIGVANVFLECLFHDVNLEYAAPIISQQGEVCGRLKVEISRLPDKDESDSESSSDGRESPEDYELEDDEETLRPGSQMAVEVKVIEAIDLPPALCHYVFCQYRFWDEHDTVVVPPVNASISHPGPKTNTMIFDHSKSFTINISEDFLEYASEGSLAIEVWGNRSKGFDSSGKTNWNIDTPTTGLQESEWRPKRWSELVRKIELWVEIHELNDQGFYTPVELQTRMESGTGGIFQLRQGHSRRVVAQVNTVPKSGQLPVVCNSISSVYIGSISSRSKSQQMLDSYQEKDISILREKWSNSLMKRREYLDDQIQSLINKPDKSPIDKERESWLIDQWVSLTEERNAVLVPLAGSGIPGAPQVNGLMMQEMELHSPVIFLDLNGLNQVLCSSPYQGWEDMVSGCVEEARPAGVDTTLPFENPDSMIELPIIKYDQKQVSATASWDSSIHDSIYLNRLTSASERVYLIVKVSVRLTSPLSMDLVLRKRICVRIYKKQSWRDTLMKKINKEQRTRCGVTYELVSHIPKQPGEETEERASLAQMAALAVGQGEEEDETVLEKYTKEISNVESLLQLDKLRQEVVVKEKLAAIGKPLRKFASTPNLAASSHDAVFGGSGRFDSPEIRQMWEARNFGRSDYIPNNSSFTEPRRSFPIPTKDSNNTKESEWKEKEKDELFLDLSQLVSPPRNPARQNSTVGTPNSRPNSILLETLLEDDSSSPSPSPRMKVRDSNFDFKPVDIPKLDLGEDGDVNDDGDGWVGKRDQRSDSKTSYENLPTPTPFDELQDGGSREMVFSSTTTHVSSSENFSTSETPTETADRDSGAATPTPDGAYDGQHTADVLNKKDLALATNETNDRGSTLAGDIVLTSQGLDSSSIDNESDLPHRSSLQTSNCPGTASQVQTPDKSSYENAMTSFGSQEELETGFDAQEWEEQDINSDLKLGTLVSVGDSKTGFIRFIGRTDFAPGLWIGVELDVPKGKNDGSVNGIRYFACKPRFGSFVRPDKVTPLDSRTPPSRRDQGRSGSRRNLSSRNDSPSRNAVLMRAQAGANRRKNEWKRRSNILF